MTSRLLTLIVAIACCSLSLATAAAAQPATVREVVMQLGDGSAPAPSHVCVVAEQIVPLPPATDARNAHKRLTLGALAGVNADKHTGSLAFDPSKLAPGNTYSGVDGIDPITAITSPSLAATPPNAASGALVSAWSITDPASTQENACVPMFSVSSSELAQRVYCESNTLPALARGELGILVLKVEKARVKDLDLSGHSATLHLLVDDSTEADAAKVTAIGGHYHPIADATERRRLNERLQLPIQRRCALRDVRLPDFECLKSGAALADEASVTLDVAGYQTTVKRAALRETPRMLVPNSAGRTTALIAGACAKPGAVGAPRAVADDAFQHVFNGSWDGRAAPEPLTLRPTKITFAWRVHCLLDCKARPETVDLPSLGVRCDGKADPNDADLMVYECRSAVSLPTSVRFRADGVSWQDRLSRPGETLDGYLPRDERYLILKWWEADPQKRLARAAYWGDQIDHLELRDASGNVYRVDVAVDKVRIPGLAADDPFVIHYVGTRSFVEQPARADGGKLKIPDPAANHADAFAFGVSLGGGVRRLSEAPESSSTRWNPYGSLEVIGMFRLWRWQPSQKFYVDFEFRPGLIITTHAYHSTFEPHLPASQPFEEWEHVPYMRFPLDLAANVALYREFLYAGVGFGPAFTREFYADDRLRVPRPVVWTLPLTLGFRVAKAFSLEARARFSFNERYIENTFDEAGLVRSEEKSTGALLLGGQLRLDDIFGGARLGMPEQEAKGPAARPNCSHSRGSGAFTR